MRLIEFFGLHLWDVLWDFYVIQEGRPSVSPKGESLGDSSGDF